MKPLQVDEKAMSVGEFENRLGWSLRVAGIAGDQRLNEYHTSRSPDEMHRSVLNFTSR
jgi:hypothetical protein